MDLSERIEHFNKKDKQFKSLKESYFAIRNKQVLKEADEHEETEPVGGEVEAPVVDDTAVAQTEPEVGTEDAGVTDDIAAAPVDTTSGKVLEANPETVIKTQAFADATIAKALATIGGGFDATADILPSGVIKKEVSDPQLGNYTILVYPTEFKAADVVATAYPVATGAETEIAQDEVAPEETPVEGSQTEAPTASEPVEGEKSEEDLAGDEEVKLEEARDPTYVGKKDWKKMISKLFENAKH